jgi:hypothetical protein
LALAVFAAAAPLEDAHLLHAGPVQVGVQVTGRA